MTIRQRLQLTGLIPIVLLFLVAGYFFITSYSNYEKASAFKDRLENNALLTDTLVKIGKERSVTALYLGSHKEKYLSSLLKQRKILDKSYQDLEKELPKKVPTYIPKQIRLSDPISHNGYTEYETLLNNLALLPSIRKAVDTEPSHFKKTFFESYTDSLTKPTLESINALHYYAINSEITSLVHTLLSLYTAQEYSDLERGFVSYFLEQQSGMPFDDILLWNTFQSKSNSYDISKISNETLRQDISHILEDKNAQTLFKEIIYASTSIKLHVSTGRYTQSAIDWFTLQSNKIALLTKAQLLISNTLWSKINTILITQLLLLILSALLLLFALFLAYLGYRTQKDISNNIYTLGEMLNHATHNMRHTDPSLNPELETVKNINLNTTEGTKKAYRFLQMLIETTQADRPVAVSTDETKPHFLEHMSHEIRTPLNNIVGFTQILRDTNLDETQSEFVSIIDKSSENLLHTINNVLDFSRIENHKVEIKNIVFDADKAFENTIETCAVEAAEKNINLYYYMDPSISKQLKGDPYKIKEVLINLLSNAIKFTQRGGEIDLNITKDEPHYITFTVGDNGIGIPQDKQAVIFNAFSQADTSVAQKYGGTGLGLTIASKFVEMMRGKLTVDSSQGKGTIFSFTIPLEEISTEETMRNGHVSDLTIGLCTNNISSKFKSNLTHYFNDIKAHIQEFDSLKQLEILEASQACQYYWIDVDKVDQDILDYMHTIDKSKLIVLAHVTSRDKIDALDLEQNTIVYKPLTFSKVRKHLNYDNHITSTIIEEDTEKKPIQFNAHVLIAEDNPINQKLIKNMLENYGITVDVAKNGRESFEKLKTTHYDLVFMDIQMPEMDGINATHKIVHYQKDANTPHIPIIALTAHALKEDKEKFLEQGMDVYLSKPIQKTELLSILNKFLNHHSSISSKAEEVESDTMLHDSHKSISLPLLETENEEPLSKPIEEDIPLEKKAVEEAHNSPLELFDVDVPTEIIETEDRLPKKILIAKKLLLERRVLITVIENIGLEYEILADSDFEAMLKSNKYDIVFSDDVSDEIRTLYPTVSIITKAKTKDEILALVSKKRG